MGKKRKIISLLIVIFLLIVIGLGIVFYLLKGDKNFYIEDSILSESYFLFNQEKGIDANDVLLKISVKQGESFSKDLRITNTGVSETNFKIKVNRPDFISVKDLDFFLGPNESRYLNISFNIENKGAGVYLEEILILNDGAVLVIPVILEIETEEVLFDSIISVPAEYSKVHPGEKIIIENKIFNLRYIEPETVEVKYSIEDFEGNVIFSEQENLAIESQFFNSKEVSIPDYIEPGNYVFMITTRQADSTGTSSYLLRVFPKSDYLNKDSTFFMWIVIFLLFGLISFIIYYIKQRDNMFIELQDQYEREIRRQKELIGSKEKSNYAKLKTSVEKEKYKKEIEKVKKERLRALTTIHKKRIKEYNKIKRKGRKNQLRKQLDIWKKEGYDTRVLEREYKIPNAKDIKKKIGEWKKKGYDTSVLEKRIKK